MIDFHNHLIPGVDDGAENLDQLRAALSALRDQDVHTVVATPHVAGSLPERRERRDARYREIDAAWEPVRELAAREFPELRLERGAEVLLDTPTPDLSDPRVRLAGTSFVLVEFPHMRIPPNADQPIRHILRDGWIPVIAHPERYGNVFAEVARWRALGACIQVNAGSLVGRYGAPPRSLAWRLVEEGWVHYLCSDHHARGRVALAEARDALLARSGRTHAELLLEGNAARLLKGKKPLEVPPLPRPPSLWNRIFARRA